MWRLLSHAAACATCTYFRASFSLDLKCQLLLGWLASFTLLRMGSSAVCQLRAPKLPEFRLGAMCHFNHHLRPQCNIALKTEAAPSSFPRARSSLRRLLISSHFHKFWTSKKDQEATRPSAPSSDAWNVGQLLDAPGMQRPAPCRPRTAKGSCLGTLPRARQAEPISMRACTSGLPRSWCICHLASIKQVEGTPGPHLKSPHQLKHLQRSASRPDLSSTGARYD